jgi:PAS domain S-box-containing protein
MRLFTSGSIRRILILLVSLALLPALAIILYSGIEQRRNAIDTATGEVQALARTMGEIQKTTTHSARQLLSSLAQMKETRSADGPAVSAIFEAVIRENPSYINIIAIDVHGMLFASGRPYETTDLSDRPHFQAALTHKSFSVGEYITSRIGEERPTLAFTYPVLDEKGEVLSVLATIINLETYDDLFDVARLPEKSFLSVNDRNGVRLYYYPSENETNPVGQPISDFAWHKVQQAGGKPGVSIHEGSDGIRRIFAFQPVHIDDDEEPYAYLWAGIPEAAVIASANIIMIRNMALMFLVAILALTTSWLVSRASLLTPIRRLASTATAYASGDLTARYGRMKAPDEVQQLAAAFDNMADTLMENQQRLRAIADYTYDWEYWLAPDKRPLWVSPSCERISGYSAAEFMADPSLFESIIQEEDKTVFATHLQKETGEKKTVQIDFRIRHKSGRILWINHHCLPIVREDGVLLGRRVSNRNITDRKMIEQALRDSEAGFRSLVEGAPVAIFVQTDFHFAYINPAGIKLFGAESTNHLIGTPVLDRLHPDFHDRVRQRIARTNLQKQAVSRDEQLYLKMDGTPVAVEVSAVPVTYEGKDGGLVFVQDISDRRQIESRLQQAQKMEAIGSLAGGIAHDFNNILSPIIGLSDMLLEDLPKESIERENVVEILTAARRAGDLVKQILSFSRQAEQEKIPLRVQQVLKEVGKLIRSSIPSNIEIRQFIQMDCAPVLADPINIHQISMNLVTNAYHAVEQKHGGVITIVLEQTVLDSDDIDGTVLRPGNYALLTITDNGHGIPADIMPRIFDPYFTTKPQSKGTGLGLSVVYGIVRDLGGDIRVSSDIDSGTSFHIYLPVIETSGSPEALKSADSLPRGNERILLVDDEASIVSIYQRMLERLGYRIISRTSSTEALELFRASPESFDLVITDKAMPEMTGELLARQIMSIRRDIPIILCTGFSEHSDADTIPAIRGILMKPLIRRDLAHEVRRVLDASRPENQS